MKIVSWVAMILFVAGLVALVVAPLGPMPGVLIGGTASEVPADWGNTESVEEIQLQVGGGPLGRTVTIWTVQVDGELYETGQKEAGWTSGIGAGGPVRLKMSGKLYELTAAPVTTGAVDVLEAWQSKYSTFNPDLRSQFPPPADAIKTAVVYRLTKRV